MDRVGLAVIPSEHSHPAPPAHPERYEKLKLVLDALERPEMEELVQQLASRRYDTSAIARVHSNDYIQELESFSEDGINYLDEDTYRSATSFGASCDVTWALLSAVDEAFADGPKVSFILGRPPGHHAEADRAMGFCLVNHVAVAAQYALDRNQAERIAVVDFDIHHGNGTQHMFYDRSDVLYVSTHQFPFYPGTGSKSGCGRNDGEEFTLNFPLPAGVDDDTMANLFENEISAVLREFAPDLILVSAGFDGHRLDPLGGFDLTGEGFRKIAEVLRAVASDQCEGRLVSLLEGGYSPEGNLDSIISYIKGLASV